MKNRFTYLYVIFSAIYLLRLLFLDADALDFNFAQVEPTDELYYNEFAGIIHKEGMHTIFSGELYDSTLANGKLFLIPTFLSALSYNLLGYNYYGLRFPHVIMGLLIGLLLINYTRKLSKSNFGIVTCVSVLYLLDFNLILLSRSATTVIPCILSLMIYLYPFFYSVNEKLRYILIGGLPIIFFMLVYGNMPFLIIFSFFYMGMHLFDNGNHKSKFLYFSVGVVSALLICEFIDLLIFKQHIWTIFTNNLLAHNNKLVLLNQSVIKSLIGMAGSIFISDIFRYNILLLFLFFLVLPISIIEIVREKNRTIFVLFSLIALYYLQGFFVSTMPASKATMIYPLILLLIVATYNRLSYFYKSNKNIKYYYFLSAVLSIFFLVYSHERIIAFEPAQRYFLYLILVTALVLFIVIRDKKYLLLPVGIVIAFNLYLDIHYVFVNRSYRDVSMLIDLNRLNNADNLINVKGFSLYNDCTSQIDDYDHYKGPGYDFAYVKKQKRLLLNRKGYVYYMCKTPSDINELSLEFGVDINHIQVIKHYNRSYSCALEPSDVTLYKISK